MIHRRKYTFMRATTAHHLHWTAPTCRKGWHCTRPWAYCRSDYVCFTPDGLWEVALLLT